MASHTKPTFSSKKTTEFSTQPCKIHNAHHPIKKKKTTQDIRKSNGIHNQKKSQSKETNLEMTDDSSNAQGLYRSVEQDRKPRIKTTHLQPTNL